MLVHMLERSSVVVTPVQPRIAGYIMRVLGTARR